MQYGCSFYDAAYLSLPELFDQPIVHADEKLRRLLDGRFRRELWIEEYRPARRPR